MRITDFIDLIKDLPYRNLDLLSVGVTVAAIVILGFIIYISNKKSSTNRAFLFLAITSALWSVINYLSYQINISGDIVIWFNRLILFSAVWFAYSIYQLAYVFPNDKTPSSRKFNRSLLFLAIFSSLITLTPFVFSGVQTLTPAGQVSVLSVRPGIIIFGLSVFFFNIGSIILLHFKLRRVSGAEKKQFELILIGIYITLALILIFNFILPAFFQVVKFIPLGALFIFPFVAFTFYAISKHHLFNIKNSATVIIAFALTVVSFAEIIFANNLSLILFRGGVFILVLIFSIQLVRNIFNLEFANDRLKELDQLKSEFVSLATHQIRAPLTSIKGYISLIQEGDYGPVSTQVNDALNIIQQSTNNLVTIVGDFLDVSRIEQGRMKYDFKNFNIQELVNQVMTEQKPNVEKMGLKLNYSFEPGQNYSIFADMGKIKQIVGNIIDNSIKYTPQGHVDVALSKPNSGKFLIKIADTGVGINPKVMPKLFQKFSRAENANDVNIMGTGLGLYVAKQMIEAHHGRVWAESEGDGKGSQFYIELPVTSTPPEVKA
jgi:signal transduction histidine kinase